MKIMSEHAPEFTYVDNAEGLARLTEALRGTVRVGLDTEADSLHHYFEKVCLIQLSFLGADYIVDPLAGLSMTDFLEALSQKELIIQGADYDLRMMKKTFEFRPKAPVFDTMFGAQVLGYEKIGLAALVEKICGVPLLHSAQKSDWAKRPLSEKQLSYASDDTRYLEKIADVMTASLQTLGRLEWHRECCERAVEISGLPGRNEGKEDAWRIKGSSKLAPQELVLLRELWKWRDEEAQRRDRPSFMILRNEDLISFTSWLSKDPREPLHAAPSYLKRVTGDVLTRLENAIRTADGLPPAQWPVEPRFVRTRGPEVSQEKVEALLAACKTIAAALRIDASFLASRATVTAVVRHAPQTLEQVCEVSGLMRWQAAQLMPAIQSVVGCQG